MGSRSFGYGVQPIDAEAKPSAGWACGADGGASSDGGAAAAVCGGAAAGRDGTAAGRDGTGSEAGLINGPSRNRVILVADSLLVFSC